MNEYIIELTEVSGLTSSSKYIMSWAKSNIKIYKNRENSFKKLCLKDFWSIENNTGPKYYVEYVYSNFKLFMGCNNFRYPALENEIIDVLHSFLMTELDTWQLTRV